MVVVKVTMAWQHRVMVAAVVTGSIVGGGSSDIVTSSFGGGGIGKEVWAKAVPEVLGHRRQTAKL